MWTLVSDSSQSFLGWKAQGSFTVPVGPTFSKPVAQAIAVTPSGSNSATVAATGFDENGSSDVKDIYLLINTSLSFGGGCYLLYRSPSQQVFLLNDAGTNWQAVGTVGGNFLLENSQCLVNLGLASESETQDTRTITYHIEFKPTFTGVRSAYLYVEDVAKLVSGWKFLRTLTLPFP